MRRAAIVTALIVAAPAAAQPPTQDRPEQPPPPPETYTTVVTGLRLPRPLRDVPATIVVVTRTEIAHSPLELSDGLLRTVPSVATFRRSSSLVADPSSQGVNLRGLGPSGASRALVLVDGVPANDPFGGWVYWRALPPIDLDQIEIEPSGASAMFGNVALGGVIHLRSRRIVPRAATVELAGGSLGTARLAGAASDRRGPVGVAVAIDAVRSDGYTPIAAYARGAVDHAAASRHLAVTARAESVLGPATVGVAARGFAEELDAGTDFTGATARLGTGAITAHVPAGGGAVDATVFGALERFTQDRARVTPDRSGAEPSAHQRVPSTAAGGGITYQSPTLHAAGAHVIVTGIDASRVTGTSHEQLLPPDPTPMSVVGRDAGGEQRFAGAFVADAVTISPAVTVTAAVRVDSWTNASGERTTTRGSGDAMTTAFPGRTDVQVDPRVGVLAHLAPQLAVRASVYRAFRAPTLNELYRPFQVGTILTDANADLGAEHLWGGEVGPELVAGTFVGRATGFWNVIDDPIENVTLAEPSPSGAMRQRQNLGRARVRGVELSLAWRPTRAWIARADYTLADAEVVAAPGHPDLVGMQLAQDPRHRATVAVGFDDPRIATVTAQARLVGRQFEDDQNQLAMGWFAVVDATASRRVAGGVAAFLTVENLADSHYVVGRAGVDTVGAPRTLMVGMRVDTQP